MTKYVMPYFNGFVSYGFKGDRAYINNYEAQFNYFPFNFKGNNKRNYYDGDVIQYRIGWNVADDSPNLKPYLQDYDLIFSNGAVKVLRHKLFTLSQEHRLDGLRYGLQFVMEKVNGRPTLVGEGRTSVGETLPLKRDDRYLSDRYLVTPEQRYRPGGYGWDTLSPRQAFDGGVRDTEDAAFRIDVPNGRYEVRCQFRSDDDRPHRSVMYINGTRAGKPFVVPGNSAADPVPPIEQIWQTVVDNGTLILVIHSLDKGENAHWVWSGCTIEKSR